MGRVVGWTVGVLLIVAGMLSLTIAPWLTPWLALTLGLAVPVALLCSWLRARRRGVRLRDAQRLDGHARDSAQDPLLGRLPYPPLGEGVDGRPTTSLIDPTAIPRDPGRLDP